MDYKLCEQFDTLRKYLPDESNTSTSNDIHNLENIKYYCSNVESEEAECKTDIDKIKAGCLWLFEQLFVKNNKNISTVEYIIIWLSYKLNQKTYDEAKDLNDFYNKYIENNRHYINCKQGGVNCSNLLNSNTGYSNYKEIIDKRKKMFNINIKNISKIYDAFKSLCNMYTELNANSTISEESLGNAKNFVKKYKELNDDSTINEDGSYKQVLSTLSIDYINFKSSCDSNDNGCNKIPSLTPTEAEESDILSSEEICYVTSSSLSIVKKLILALLIFSAISIFLGIFFKVNNKKFKNYFH
ncbi:putative yir1 protein [Plasmodium yoelii yoelii]|uniref:Yir1 protein n=1 Tax=Plasmodium yoelii yoelii TaxID=73239 RepID=Q7RB77_PLAYO|nr:putative yir1 protein [Plasmodium yoelii yoelii]